MVSSEMCVLDIELWWSALSLLSYLVVNNDIAKDYIEKYMDLDFIFRSLLLIMRRDDPLLSTTAVNDACPFVTSITNLLGELCVFGERCIPPSKPYTSIQKFSMLLSPQKTTKQKLLFSDLYKMRDNDFNNINVVPGSACAFLSSYFLKSVTSDMILAVSYPSNVHARNQPPSPKQTFSKSFGKSRTTLDRYDDEESRGLF